MTNGSRLKRSHRDIRKDRRKSSILVCLHGGIRRHCNENYTLYSINNKYVLFQMIIIIFFETTIPYSERNLLTHLRKSSKSACEKEYIS